LCAFEPGVSFLTSHKELHGTPVMYWKHDVFDYGPEPEGMFWMLNYSIHHEIFLSGNLFKSVQNNWVQATFKNGLVDQI